MSRRRDERKFDERWCYNLRESSRNRARELLWNIRFTLRWIPMSNIKGREVLSFWQKQCASHAVAPSLSPSLLLSFPDSLLPFSFSFSPLFLADLENVIRPCLWLRWPSAELERGMPRMRRTLIQRRPPRYRTENLRDRWNTVDRIRKSKF